MRLYIFVGIIVLAAVGILGATIMWQSKPILSGEEPQVTSGETLVYEGPLLTDDVPISTPGDDTPLFVYSWNESEPYEGLQSYGTMHKVGVHESVDTLLGGSIESMSGLLAYNADRDQALTDAGHPPTLPQRHWRVLVENADVLPGGGYKLSVAADSGDANVNVDGSLEEEWEFVNGSFSLISRKFVDVSSVGMY